MLWTTRQDAVEAAFGAADLPDEPDPDEPEDDESEPEEPDPVEPEPDSDFADPLSLLESLPLVSPLPFDSPPLASLPAAALFDDVSAERESLR